MPPTSTLPSLLQVAVDALQWRGMPPEQIIEALVGLGIGLAANQYGREKAIALTIQTLRVMLQDLYEARAEAAESGPLNYRHPAVSCQQARFALPHASRCTRLNWPPEARRLLPEVCPYARALPNPTPLETKAVGDAGEFEGYGSTFYDVDFQGDAVLPGAFTKSLGERWPVCLFGHSQQQVIGKWVECREDSRGLFVKAKLNLDVLRAREVFSMLKSGDVGGLSIGFDVPAGGREQRGLVTCLKAVDLFEVSVVAIAANANARVTAVKAHVASIGELEERLRAVLPGRVARKVASGGWPALNGSEADEPDPAIDAFAQRIEARTRQLKGL